MLDFVFGSRVLVLPQAALTAGDNATATDWRVLCAFAANADLCRDENGALLAARELSISESEVQASLAFWRGAGVIVQAKGKAEAEPKMPPPTKTARPLPEKGLPTYTAEELAGIVSGNKDFSALIGACQQTFGKIFNTAEVNIIAGLIDYLGLEGDYILLLLSHCVRMEKKSLRYAEKTALSLYDDGVTSASALEERLQRIETMATAVGKVRTMFGMGSRALTAKERTMIEKWVCTMKYDFEVLRLAYEATVNATTNPSVAYANTILERWFAEGYKTAEDVTNAMEEYRRKKLGGSSFDADEVLNAMLKKTYGEA